MKRDLNLIRLILLELEQFDIVDSSKWHPRGYTFEQVNYHAHLCQEAGFAKGAMEVNLYDRSNNQTTPIKYIVLEKLTWQGHEICDIIRSDERWRKMQQRIDETTNATYGVNFSSLIKLFTM